ncbi:MAG: virulence RhuM family protein [Coprobacillaceae bacterium]
MENKKSEILMYQTVDGLTRIEVQLNGETVWLTQNQMAELFQTTKQNISLHIINAFNEGELTQDAVVKEFLTTASDGKKYRTKHYNLDVIISVGYRVKSLRGTQFRIWANQILKEYLIKGFTMNDDRLKEYSGGNYFDELLERIRDIRSSEKVFWRKVLDIYSTSIDYDSKSDATVLFFKTVQNKIHYATHGKTAAEVIHSRVDSEKDNMGLTNWKNDYIRKSDVVIAKNYLNEQELSDLNLIVTAYLDFAELQARRRNPMYMKNWLDTLDIFLKASNSEILEHAGKMSHKQAPDKAIKEYEKYKQLHINDMSKVEKDFERLIHKAKSLK